MKITRFIIVATLTIPGLNIMAQGTLSASGDIVGSPSGGNYSYALSITDNGSSTSDLGSFWYGWTPGNFYLPATPSSASAPSGWTATIFNNSIQFEASSSASYLTPGSTLSGFSFITSSTPSQMEGTDNGTPVGTTVAYAMGFFSSPSDTFVFNTTAVPEPSPVLLVAAGAIGAVLRRRK